MLNIAIVEDNTSLRTHLREVVNAQSDMRVVFDTGLARDCLDSLNKFSLDIVLLDLDLPDGHGLDIIQRISSGNSSVKVMVFSVFGDERHVIEAIQTGANGYILKDDSSQNIINAIRETNQGGAPISPAIARHLFKLLHSLDNGVKSTPSTSSPLSQRETDVLTRISLGYTSAEIATELQITSHTVNTHIKHIYEKLAVNNRMAAVNKARAEGMLDGD